MASSTEEPTSWTELNLLAIVKNQFNVTVYYYCTVSAFGAGFVLCLLLGIGICIDLSRKKTKYEDTKEIPLQPTFKGKCVSLKIMRFFFYEYI